ncbi:MAG TPA: hypothetical protein VFZ35_04510 [Sphingomicrobium sp.]
MLFSVPRTTSTLRVVGRATTGRGACGRVTIRRTWVGAARVAVAGRLAADDWT